MGFSRALTAMIIGNLIMLGYVGALGVLGTRRGVNFALLASVVFGRKGYVIASGLLSTLLLGWYAVQTGITGALVSGTYGLSYVLMTIIAGLLYIAITFVGVRGLHYIGLVSIPLFLVLGLWVAADAASGSNWAAIMACLGNNGAASMSIGVGLTVVMALFIDPGIVIAAGNVWSFFIQWLSLLGVVVPPIGAIILVDQYVTRPGAKVDADYRKTAFVAWAIGSAVAFVVEEGAPQFSTALCSMIVGGVAYWVLSILDRSVVQTA